MEIIETSIRDLVILQPKVLKDHRGYFLESYKQSFFEEHFPHVKFIQDNQAKSKRGVLRGLHFQIPPFAQTKLVRVIQGEVLDVAVDLRIGSKTYGKYETFVLNDKNKKQILIPKGFAHGYVVLSESAVFLYKVDNSYAPNHESGIIYNDTQLNINWQLNNEEIQISEKDRNLLTFKAFNRQNEKH